LTGVTVKPPFLYFGNLILNTGSPDFVTDCSRSAFSLWWSAASSSLQCWKYFCTDRWQL